MPPSWDDEPDDVDEYDDESGEEVCADQSSELLSCPQCGAEIHEQSEQCPVCLAYITHPTNIWFGRPWWWILFGALGIIGVIIAMLL